MKSALILFAHGARDPEWANPLRRVQAAISARNPSQRVELAFLEFMTPTLEALVDQLDQEGVRQIAIVPMFIAQGGHLKRDLPLMLDALRDARPHLNISLSAAIGEQEPVIQAMADAALGLLAD